MARSIRPSACGNNHHFRPGEEKGQDHHIGGGTEGRANRSADTHQSPGREKAMRIAMKRWHGGNGWEGLNSARPAYLMLRQGRPSQNERCWSSGAISLPIPPNPFFCLGAFLLAECVTLEVL